MTAGGDLDRRKAHSTQVLLCVPGLLLRSESGGMSFALRGGSGDNGRKPNPRPTWNIFIFIYIKLGRREITRGQHQNPLIPFFPLFSKFSKLR